MSSPTADTVVPNEALTAPQLPTSVQALQQAAEGLRQAGAAQATPGQAPIEAVDAGVSPVPALPGAFPWLWLVLLVVVVGLAAVAGVWWWRRRTRKPRPALPKDTPETEFDPLREWNQFRAQLAPKMRRVLDDFQPVIVLGDVASEKERVVEQLAGVEDSLRLHGPSAVFRGKALHVFLGDCTLLVAPTYEFCRQPDAPSDAGWQAVLRRVGCVRPPRVVVCISSVAVDLGGTAELRDWMGVLRQHTALVAAVRGENIDVHPVLAQPPSTGRAEVRAAPTEGLFELVRELVLHDEGACAQRVTLGELGVGRSEEERTAAGYQWAQGVLWSYYRGWTKLFTRKGQDAEDTLALVRLFEDLPKLSSGLGMGLAELLADVSSSEAPRGIGKELVLLPSSGERLLGTLVAFDPPQDDAGDVPWYPSARLRHRLWVTSGAMAVATLLCAAFHFDKLQWQRAATASQTYGVPDESADFRIVEEYFKHRSHGADAWLPNFFDRDLPRRALVNKMRAYLKERITNPPVPEKATPEAQLQLVTLYITGSPSDCNIPGGGATTAEFQRLTQVISDNIEQWSRLTGFDHREVAGYLDMACPQEDNGVLKGLELQCDALGGGNAGAHAADPHCPWKELPRAAEFVSALASLTGSCNLHARERDAISRAEDIQRDVSSIGSEHGAAKLVLDAVKKIDHETMRALASMFSPYADRLKAVSELATENEDMGLLIADVRSFLEAPAERDASTRHGCSGRLCTLQGFNDRLQSLVTIPPRSGVLSVELGGQTHVVERQRMRDSLEAAAFERLVSTFGRQTPAINDIFFQPGDLPDGYRWYTDEIPPGLRMTTRVSPRYTVRAFEDYVRRELDTTMGHVRRLGCPARGEATSSGRRADFSAASDLERLLAAQLSVYTQQYLREWSRVYGSFQIDDSLSAPELTRVLDVLSRPDSPQLQMLRTVVAQTSLPSDDGFSFTEPLEPVTRAFAELTPVVDDAAFEGYRALLQELVASVGLPSRPAGGGTPTVEPPADAGAAREQFGAKLPTFGKVTWSELGDPATALTLRAKAWLDAAGVPPRLQEPFLAPFQAAARLGQDELQSEVNEWWRRIAEPFEAQVLSRFPFARDAETEVETETLAQWLHPTEGTFAIEVVPIVESLRGCKSCRKRIDVDIYERARAIQAALFGPHGTPKPLLLTIAPLPFASQQLAPKKSSLQLDAERYEYFNTEPRPLELAVAWDKPHNVALRVEFTSDALAGAADQPTPLVLSEAESPWALLRLLRKGAPEGVSGDNPSGVYRFSLGPDARRRVQVAYQVCAWAGRCGGLFGEVLRW